MRVRLLFFGVLRELAGASERETTLDEGATVADVVSECERMFAGRATWPSIWPSIATAVHEEYAPRSRELKDGDVVALLPPVSGG